jgi:putative nucleotidyltransferase with HDIG domain
VVAYDQRLAFVISSLHALLLAFALKQPIGVLIILIVAAGLAPVLLKEIRDRRTLINMSLISGVTLAAVTLLVGPIDRPLTAGAFEDLIADAAFAGAGGLLVGSIVFVILPVIENVFDITTGMTLIERRDPKQPLLRELQQRAPGTYNHSLNVASISEAAADAIGADPLLTYVGGLYHDIGKMNKPEYFVENQSGGPNKHDKLSPAMSLLVIVGHVKDGLELAREFDLPRPLHHFIEAHHGTTLVEYFFERAKRQVLDEVGENGEAAPEPDEIEYRYPGPRPRTKEVAILMLADAVESATRSMAEPTPSRIDALVRDLAAKRLLDGQFDDCDLSLKELRTVADSISKSVASIYHGRIAYPSDKKDKEEKKAEKSEKAEKRA